MSKFDRRQMIKLAAVAGAGVLIPRKAQASAGMFASILEKISQGIKGTIGREVETPLPVKGARFGMVIDLGLCIGCRRCSYACKLENNVPDAINPPYIMVFETKYRPGQIMDDNVHIGDHSNHNGLLYTRLRRDRMYMPVQCNHCADPPCAKVCPTKATFKTPDGIVMMDYNKCIGCRYCMAACPYNARRFNWQKVKLDPEKINPLVPVRTDGVVEKCTFCVHRTRRGRTTRCVEVCPNRARTFGNFNDPNSAVSKLVEGERSFRLKVGLNTGPQIYYLTRPKKKPMRWFKPVPISPNVRGLKK